MTDIEHDPDEATREVATVELHGHEATAVVLRREYAHRAEEVWRALADVERLSRWFAPVEGDLSVGGRFQVQGNAGGEVLDCDAPRLARVTWELGEQPEGRPRDEVALRLTPTEADGTILELVHTAIVDPEFWARFGPGATGVGWDLAFLGLELHLAAGGEGRGVDAEAFAASDEGAEIIERASAAWARAAIEFGTRPEDAVAAGGRTTAFYTGRPDPDAAE
jgi:uncharacterized protein YndB with AHSA1/START domain